MSIQINHKENTMSFELFCGAIIGLAFAVAVCFSGYRLFLSLLPLWGLVFGFVLGAQAVQAVFGSGFLGSITSWMVGLVVAVIFAALSYLFYALAIALFSFSAGYSLGIGLMALIGSSFGLINFVVGVVLGVIMVFVVLRFDIQKWVIIITTSIAGALGMAGIVLFGMRGMAVVDLDLVAKALKATPVLMILAIVAAVAGIFVQYRSTQTFVIEIPKDKM
jgi:hypothetical protein